MIARFLHCVHHRLSSAAFRYMPLMTTLPGDDETGECNGAAQQRTTSALKSNGSYDRWKTLCIRTIILFVTLALLLWLLFGLPSSIVKWFPKTFDGLEYGDLFKPVHSTAAANDEHDVENSSSNKDARIRGSALSDSSDIAWKTILSAKSNKSKEIGSISKESDEDNVGSNARKNFKDSTKGKAKIVHFTTDKSTTKSMKKDDEILMENEHRQEIKETVSSLYGISRQRIALNCYASDVAPDITGDRKKQYVTVNIPKAWQCGALGNQFYRFASLYGIGRAHNRRPIMFTLCDTEKEVERSFPVYFKHNKLYSNVFPNQNHNDKNTEYFWDFAKEVQTSDCGRFFDHNKLPWEKASKKPLVMLGGNYMQHFRYFHAYRNEIRELYKCSRTVCNQALEAATKQKIGSDPNHKLCVHTRLGDFVALNFHSSKEFTEQAIDFIAANGKLLTMPNGSSSEQKRKIGLSLVLFGQDKGFLQSLSYNKTRFKHIYIPLIEDRDEDFCFARLYCDSFLITASTSSYAWWISYLLPDGTPVFFDTEPARVPYNADGFLREWTPLRLQQRKQNSKEEFWVEIDTNFFAQNRS